MVGPLPKRPDGRLPESLFSQAAWDHINGLSRRIEVDGGHVNKTTRGTYELPDNSGGGGASTALQQYRLWDVTDDYLICKNPPKPPSGLSPVWLGQLIADPADPDAGVPVKNDAYYNVTDKVFKIFDGSSWQTMTQSATLVYVAKPPDLRTSLFGERILGTNHAYTYGDGPEETWAVATGKRFNVIRTDTASSSPEDQRVVRPWIEQELIFAVPANNTGVSRPKLDEHGAPVLDGDGNPVLLRLSLLHVSPSRQWSRKRG